MREYRISDAQLATLFAKCGKALTWGDGKPFCSDDIDEDAIIEFNEIVHCIDCIWSPGDILTCTFWSDRNKVLVDPMNFCAWGRLRK